MEDMGKWNPVTFVRDSIAWLMNLASQVTESLWLALPGNLRQMWDDFQNALQMHMTPGERFGRDAVFIFLVGTVPAFLAGSSSAAMLFGITPGFIAGLGLIVAFFHCQTSRSRERRMKVRCRQLAQLQVLFLEAFCDNILRFRVSDIDMADM